MVPKHLLTVLLFTTSLSMFECSFSGVKSVLTGIKGIVRASTRHRLKDCKEGSIAKFLCTKEPIWLYNSTGRPDRDCEVDETMNINQTSVLLLRSLYQNGTKTSINLMGTFQLHNPKRMFLHIPDMPDSLTENMEYLSKKLRCAILRITLPGHHAVYDLLVRNSSIERGPSRRCIKEFAKLTSTSLRMYQPHCQNILLQRMEPEFTIVTTTKPTKTHLR
ncbi:uncharacterized protein [Dermacentor albipictus]|uniref:uncharacterized protein n=1 Tax=Dermacentor albipictus TaxID=60249 RepID=UPI0038FD01BE